MISPTPNVPGPTICDFSFDDIQSINQNLISRLGEGYTVDQGALRFIDIEDTDNNNPSTQYGAYTFILRNSDESGDIDDVSISPFWTLGGNEATVFIGCTPPPHVYYGFHNYVYKVRGINGTEVFASHGNALNHLNIGTVGSVDKPSLYSGAFGKLTAIVSSNEHNLTMDLIDLVEQSGVPEQAINPAPMPLFIGNNETGVSHIKYGTELETDDMFGTLFRLTIPANLTEQDAYRALNYSVFRIRKDRDSASQIYLTVPEPVRGGDTPAESTNQTLTNELSQSLNRTRYQKVSEGFEFLREDGLIYSDKFTPEYCLYFETNCQGDSKDTTYIVNPAVDSFRYKPGFLYTFTGVDHYKTNKCTYTSLSVSRFRAGFNQNLTDAVANSQGLFSLTNFDYKYRNIGDEVVEIDLTDNCTSATGINCLELDKDQVKPGDYLVFIERCYLEPATKVGPNPDELIRPVIQSFKSRTLEFSD